ncbi:MAG: sulfotransferase family protein [Pseudomonadota bacterium]
MPKILALWAVPRSTSTAFEWMMRQRGDMTCFHEPFGEAWYQGEAPLWPRATASSKRTPGLTLQSVRDHLFGLAEADAIFIKDFPHYIDHMWDDAFLSHFTHSFLIRDPAKTITSMFDKWPDFHKKEVGFSEQRMLFDRITEMNGNPPPVLDSDDLLEDPVGMVRVWSEAVGIPFMESALSWEPGARDEVSWWDGGSFHANLRNSDGLKPQKRTYKEIGDVPDRVRTIYDECLTHYRHLHAFRLKA